MSALCVHCGFIADKHRHYTPLWGACPIWDEAERAFVGWSTVNRFTPRAAGDDGTVEGTLKAMETIMANAPESPATVQPPPPERKEQCTRCGNYVADWVDPDWASGRICLECESKYQPPPQPAGGAGDLAGDGSNREVEHPSSIGLSVASPASKDWPVQCVHHVPIPADADHPCPVCKTTQPPPPPVSNEFVAEGCEQFTSSQIDALKAVAGEILKWENAAMIPGYRLIEIVEMARKALGVTSDEKLKGDVATNDTISTPIYRGPVCSCEPHQPDKNCHFHGGAT